jgi:putative methyltransferase (TIGR04325 family)
MMATSMAIRRQAIIIIQTLVPPLLWRCLVKVGRPWSKFLLGLQPASQAYGFSGRFPSFDSALAACGVTAKSENYQNSSIIESTLARTRVLRDSFKEKKPEVLNAQTLRLLAAFEYVILADQLREITVVDFGGAMGNHYFKLRGLLPTGLTVNWTVIDLPRTVEAASRELANQELSFKSSLDQVKGTQINLVLASSSLQYTPSPYEFLEKIVRLQSPWIVTDRMPFLKEESDRIVTQKVPPEIYDASYPVHFLAENKFEKYFIDNGLEICLRWKSEEEVVNLEGLLVPYQGMLFRRRI